MTILATLFYLLAALVLGAAALAVTRRQAVHAVLFLIVALVGVALLFLLLGAPMLAALQVILYAGAIMVLFLFVIITMPEQAPTVEHLFRRRWLLPFALCLVVGFGLLLLINTDPATPTVLTAARLTPRTFGLLLFKRYWYAVELVSLLLFVGLVGALYLGRPGKKAGQPTREESR
jgi:NADH-quinone oxidoreductase subunit J